MKILLPVDGSELSLEAVRFAVRLLKNGLQGTVVLANVQPQLFALDGYGLIVDGWRGFKS
mgnify:CR=1 FL=1